MKKFRKILLLFASLLSTSCNMQNDNTNVAFPDECILLSNNETVVLDFYHYDISIKFTFEIEDKNMITTLTFDISDPNFYEALNSNIDSINENNIYLTEYTIENNTYLHSTTKSTIAKNNNIVIASMKFCGEYNNARIIIFVFGYNYCYVIK